MENIDFKIVFWVIAIGIYIFSQIREAIKKTQQNTPVPTRPQVPYQKPLQQVNRTTTRKPIQSKYTSKVPSYKAKKPLSQQDSKRSTIEDELLGREMVRREAFYKETHTKANPIDYDDSVKDDKGIAAEYAKQASSVFGVDEHLEPYTLKKKVKHPLLSFLSDKNNLRNAFISSEIFNRKG
ncbi:MAG: hypothetical protein H7259_06060 [Cytophagales bacterium]|nr:hypothetical protein [Cytophaga sp.]